MLPLRHAVLAALVAACLGSPVLARNDHGGDHGKGKGHASKHEKHAGKHAAKAARKAHKALKQEQRQARREDRRDERRAAGRDDRVAGRDGRRDRVRSTAVLGAGAATGAHTVRIGSYFTESHRNVVRRYAVAHASRATAPPAVVAPAMVPPTAVAGDGHRSIDCPPGLAKKDNGCLPPGQAKKYALGQPLPRAAGWAEVPPPLLAQLPPPPMGYRYVRVDNDLLLLALSTAVVVDVLAGLLG